MSRSLAAADKTPPKRSRCLRAVPDPVDSPLVREQDAGAARPHVSDHVVADRHRTLASNDVVCAALRLPEDREMRRDAIRHALVAGENSGTPTPFDFDEFVSRKDADAANTLD